MEVVVPLASLQKHGACPAYLDSPEWSKDRQALVYSDWSETVDRLLSTKWGTSYLDWLVGKKLVPMTAKEFDEARQRRRAMNETRNPPPPVEPNVEVPEFERQSPAEFRRLRAQSRVLGAPAADRTFKGSPAVDPNVSEEVRRTLAQTRILGGR